ncbi:hypothetical protein [Frigoribacterium sp. CG_9.8]|uniref:hypothetical protein n=1 Tax=Frigoribacterium sp. CG_9.8 TaxID=2787733 RepID=UPI0018C9DF16|nr:hypothetical protein [Frigoribacterium sp. CG_9.8]MBG6106622.1 hypothetical protein [Frigoribacterium sp. CG_9.8]
MSKSDGSTSPTEEEPEGEPGITVVEPMTEVEPTSVTATSPKRYIAPALGAGFEVKCGTSKTLETRPAFKGGAKAGDTRPDIEVTHLWIQGWVPQAAWFRLHFKNNRFEEAMVWDVAGWPTELQSDYAPSALIGKRVKDEPEWAWKERMQKLDKDVHNRDYDYNDGEFWLNHQPRSVKVAGELEEWLADLIPGFEPRKKPVKKVTQEEKQATATAVELIEMGTWIG